MKRFNQDNTKVRVNVLPTDKFKTTTITCKFMAPLNYKTITALAFLSKVRVWA
ncbi:insulinase family protein, partial [Staphylococcus epidermidis]|nr:insulinase family protein [Staphylococcus epidermidis]